MHKWNVLRKLSFRKGDKTDRNSPRLFTGSIGNLSCSDVEVWEHYRNKTLSYHHQLNSNKTSPDKSENVDFGGDINANNEIESVHSNEECPSQEEESISSSVICSGPEILVTDTEEINCNLESINAQEFDVDIESEEVFEYSYRDNSENFMYDSETIEIPGTNIGQIFTESTSLECCFEDSVCNSSVSSFMRQASPSPSLMNLRSAEKFQYETKECCGEISCEQEQAPAEEMNHLNAGTGHDIMIKTSCTISSNNKTISSDINPPEYNDVFKHNRSFSEVKENDEQYKFPVKTNRGLHRALSEKISSEQRLVRRKRKISNRSLLLKSFKNCKSQKWAAAFSDCRYVSRILSLL